MSRPIKYRGREKKQEWIIKYTESKYVPGELVYGSLLDLGGDDIYIVSTNSYDEGRTYDEAYKEAVYTKVYRETVGKYTGLPDRNGKEIYDNAVVLITGEQELDYGYTFRWNEKAIVKWDDVECGFYLDVINKREVKLCEDGCFTVDRFPLRKWTDEEWWIEYEVIHEHYSLLKGDSKDA
ncbi:YopX family protein [Paenibacillus alvei]|uniref:YopX family protein n=1 Tax=Paenibacillus alvei TaxID=44250 RepID=A0ABT4H7J1_PAEAL|nr:YopX family protein [Paenibacillus alvei]EJW14748.1 protein YopX [Paenibacillus alvei DSM 29]MCY9539213.1 YopX family protein [Paenibacillus alvei]MCY9708149.1 YopX family protein [Paenibacillus alvei]MCY9738205.1 YopX family protein [Paenibacillus alvei]MCY9758837.1 YopX family protein [Paenibacillus alvei]